MAGRSTSPSWRRSSARRRRSAGAWARREVFPDKNVYLAILFSMFLHGSILHVLGNMLFLWIFGNNVEDRLGPIAFLLFYLLAGVVATAAHVAFNAGSTVPTIGASGAIAGVMGAYIVWLPHARVLSLIPILFFFGFIELPAAVVLGVWFVTQFFTNPNEGIAWLAHVGGFTFGAAVAFALRGCCRRARWVRLVGARLGAVVPHRTTTTGIPASAAATAAASSARRSHVRVRGDEMRRERARSAATNAGAGSGTDSSLPGPATPDSTSANGQPSAAANAPSVDGRSPTMTPDAPKRSRTSATVAASGLPATSGTRPDAVATAATSAPAPGTRPSGRIGGVDVGRDEAGPGADRVGGTGQAFEVEVAVPADHDRVGRGAIDHDVTPRLQRLDDAGAGAGEHARPAGSSWARSAAAACALDPTSSPSASTPTRAASRRSPRRARSNCSSGTRRGGRPRADRRRPRPSPGSASSPRQITPSRSQQTIIDDTTSLRGFGRVGAVDGVGASPADASARARP